jgi:mannose-6-phosphate isomerase-like protein (cupin superfamily)
MIHSKSTTLCIKKANNEVTMTTRLSQITSLLTDYNIVYGRKTLREINEILQGIPDNGYLDYEIFESVEPMNMDLHYHDDLEARVITTGLGTFLFPSDDAVIELQVSAGDYIVIPGKMKHSFKTPGNLAAIRLFTNYDGYIANYV